VTAEIIYFGDDGRLVLAPGTDVFTGVCLLALLGSRGAA
jgi:hypothetical protein